MEAALYLDCAESFPIARNAFCQRASYAKGECMIQRFFVHSTTA